MRTLIPIILILVLCGCQKNETYFVLIGDQSVPSYEEIEPGTSISGKMPLMVFSNHEGSSIEVLWDGRKEAVFSGTGGITLSRKSGLLELKGLAQREMYLFILKGSPDGSSGILLEKSIISAGHPFSFKRELK